MKKPAFSLSAFLFRDDPESRLLWEKYQLSITPKFHAVLTALLTIASIRNVLGGETFVGTLAMTLLLTLTTATGYYRNEWFLPLARVTSFAFMGFIAWNYFAWAPGYPSPTLIMLPVTVLVAVFADHLLMCTAFLLLAAGLLLHAASNVPVTAPEQYELLLAFAVTTGMLYISSGVLWFLLHGLFTSRARLSEALQSSLTLRRSLLTVFFDTLALPLARLEQQLRSDTVAWRDPERTAAEIKDVLRHAREITLGLGSRVDLDQNSNERELEQLRNRVWMFLLLAGLASCLLIIAAGLSGSLVVRIPELGAAFVLGLLLWMHRRHASTAQSRVLAIYFVAGFIAAACALSVLDQRPPVQIVYFYVPIFCAAFISGSLHSAITTAIAAVFVGLWYLTYPPLEGLAAYMRSNILLGLIFMLAFSHIVWTQLRQLLRDIAERHNRLRSESETRQRLMATLFHDIANPLQVIHGNAELALHDSTYTPELALLRSLTRKIRALVSFTRDFEDLEQSGGELPVEPVELTGVFADLQATFAGMLAAKGLTLIVPGEAPPVLAHGAILGTSVFSNLLTNAIKFSPRGGSIRISTETIAGQRLRITLQDDGHGLPADILHQLQRGVAVQSTTGTAGERGDGQGLRLVTLYLNRMNGKLVVDAASAIAVELPLAS